MFYGSLDFDNRCLAAAVVAVFVVDCNKLDVEVGQVGQISHQKQNYVDRHHVDRNSLLTTIVTLSCCD